MPSAPTLTRAPGPVTRTGAGELERLRLAVLAAQTAVEGAKQKCLAAGQLLNEIRARLAHGEFTPWLAKQVPEISADTAQRGMRAAAHIAQALPPPDAAGAGTALAVSEILTRSDRELSPENLRYKQSWFDFTAGKSIKDCLTAVLVEGNGARRVDRAVNARRPGGTTQAGDRQDFPVFIASRLKDIAARLEHYPRLPAARREEIEELLRTVVAGGEVSFTRAARRRVFQYRPWPAALARIAFTAAKQGAGRRD